MADYFSPRKREQASLIRDLLSTQQDVNQKLEFKHASTEPLYKSALALGTGFLSDVNLIVHGTSGSEPSGEDVNNNSSNDGRTSRQAEHEFKEFKCHKLILSMNSRVFHTMFHGSLPETEDVHIYDTNANAFQLFLQYIYAGLFPTNISVAHAIDLLYLAHKYEVEQLETAIAAKLQQELVSGNTLSILKVAELYDLRDLLDMAWAHVDYHTEVVIQSVEWLQLEKPKLDSILERRTLHVDEWRLFQRAIDWASAEATREGHLPPHDSLTLRRILGSSLYLFTFPTMSAESFANGPATAGILTDAELVKIFMYICGRTLPRPNPKPFPSWKRSQTPTTAFGARVAPPPSGAAFCECRRPGSEGQNCSFCFLVAPYRNQMKKAHSHACANSGPVEKSNGQFVLIEQCVQEYNHRGGDRNTNTPPTLQQKLVRASTPASYCPCRTQNSCTMRPPPTSTPPTAKTSISL